MFAGVVSCGDMRVSEGREAVDWTPPSGSDDDAADDDAVIDDDDTAGVDDDDMDDDDDSAGPLFWEDVAPIVYKNCLSCHTEGGIAPMELKDYDDAVRFAPLIANEVEERNMPPWNVDNSGDCNTYKDARWLTEDEIETIVAWARGDRLEGDAAMAPAIPDPPPGLDEVTASVNMGVDYEPDDEDLDDNRCFVMNPDLSADAYLVAFDIRPGAKTMVHHVVVFALPDAAAEAQVAALDAGDERPGYTCYGGPGATGASYIMGWGPGSGPTYFPEGTGIKMLAGRKLVMQVHYNLINGVTTDNTAIDMKLRPGVDNPAFFYRFVDWSIFLPAGEPLIVETSEFVIPPELSDATLWGVAPHMHEAGKIMHVEFDREGEETQCVLDVFDWDFHWQNFNLYETPLHVVGGDIFRVSCGYDTTDREVVTTFGEGTADEMCNNLFYIAPGWVAP